MRTPGSGRHLVRRALRALVVVLLLLVGTAAPALAHSDVERSDPSNGGMVAPGRTELALRFDAPIVPAGSSFTLERRDRGAGAVATTTAFAPDGVSVRLTTPPLETGTYLLTWAVTGADGHSTHGTVIFGSGFRPDGIAISDAVAPSAPAVGVRLLDLGGVLLALGALVVVGRVLGALGGLGTRLRRRVLVVGTLGGLVSLLGVLATPLLTVANQVGSDAGAGRWASAVQGLVLSSGWGRLWLARVVGIVVAVAALSVAVHVERRAAGGSRGRRCLQVALGALVTAVVLDGFSGHSASLPARTVPAALVAALHVLAASVWAGGLVVLVLVVVPLMRVGAPTRRELTPATWRAFGPLAVVSTIVLAATGLYEAGRHVGSLGAVTDSTYGLALVTKVLLVGVVLAIAGYNATLVEPAVTRRVGVLLGKGAAWRPRTRKLATTVTVEGLLLLLVVAVAAAMTSVPTARESDVARAVVTPHSATLDGYFVVAEIAPNGDTLHAVVRTEPVVRPVVHPVTGVDVAVARGDRTGPVPAPAPARLQGTEGTRFEGTVAGPADGPWTASVVVHRAGLPDGVVTVHGETPSPSAVGRPEVLGTLGGLALLVLAGVLLFRRGRGRPSPSAPSPAAPAAAQTPSLQEASR
ncbi:copper resistance CopC/CopD family protein [Phycicoccus duodecadis]|uniref:Copper transport protein n=1 Tax=Phycicoccus duodecadis TaxID=173053 RepID=A0A2N3YH95_9MICO|nr:copper resistance protein CopC [Phycicoccus duodecadis]PKW26213.1 copper transport protein [Phycicoccus duodecadis]